MKTLRIALIFALGMLSVGCSHAQVTPTPPKAVDLTWQAPVGPGCTVAAPCAYDVSRSVLTAGATVCPAVNYATPNYTPLNSASPVAALAFNDTGAQGLTACYVVQTVQNGQISNASNTAGPFVVPAVPGAPSISGAVADAVEPPLPLPNGKAAAPVLTAVVR